MKTQSNTFKVLKEYMILTAATLLMDIGIYVFKYPNNFTFGGITGVSILLSKVTPLTTATINLIFNMGLLIVGIIILGKGFTSKTIYVSTLSAVMIYILEKIWYIPAPLTSEPMLELVFAVLLPALASAVLFNMNASSGGTDIIAMILKKYTSLNIGMCLLCVDIFIAVSTFIVFDIQTGLFALLGLMAKSLIIDNVIESINTCKYFNVICNNPEPICDFICSKLDRSATVYEAQGAFSHQKKYVIMTAMKRRQAVELRNFIRQTEPTAFILISNTSEIIGKGFRGFN